MDRSWKLILVLGGIFAAGGVTGGLVMLRVARPAKPQPHQSLNQPPPPRPVDDWGRRQFSRFKEKLELTAEQQEKIGALLRATQEELRTIRQQSMAKVAEGTDRMHTQIAALLTPEQKARFETLLKEDRERRRNAQMERERGGRSERPPPPADGAPRKD